ncbi:MAG: hypothetical protein IKI90_05505 [Treponema sp.]|nr:hypothetical protein [Treponema sp.]
MKKVFSIIGLLLCIIINSMAQNAGNTSLFTQNWNASKKAYTTTYDDVHLVFFIDADRKNSNFIFCTLDEKNALSDLVGPDIGQLRLTDNKDTDSYNKIYQELLKKAKAFGKKEKEGLTSLSSHGLTKSHFYISEKLYGKNKDIFDSENCQQILQRLESYSYLSDMNISIFSTQQREQPPADNKTYKWIKDKFNITFSFDILVGNKIQKIGVLIASWDLPDIVEIDTESPYFQQVGALRDLKPLIEKYGPNLKKHYSSVWNQMIDADSEKDKNGNITREHIYSLPNYGVYDGIPSDTYYNTHAFWIQKAVLKEFGYPTIKTVDQYFDLLEKYYKKYPTIDGMPTIPFSINTADWEASNLWDPPQFLAGYPWDGSGHVDKKGGKYVFTDGYTDANAKKWYKLANGYYQRNLIDPASFTDNRDQYYTKIAQGRVLGMFIQGWEFSEAESVLLANGKEERTYVPLALTFNKSTKPHYRYRSLPEIQKGYGITSKCPENKAIEIIKFMDMMLEEENQKVLYWGFEGEDYLIDEDGSVTGTKGAAYRTDKQREQQKDPYWQNKNRAMLWAYEAPKLEGKMPSGYTRLMDDLPWEYKLTQNQIDIDVLNAYGVSSYAELVDSNTPENPFWFPMWMNDPNMEAEGAELDAAIAKIGFEEIQRKYLPKLIICKPSEFEKTWKEYTSQLKPLTSVYNKYMQEQLDNLVKKFGPSKKK